MKKHNYSAGPCILPQEVFKKAAESVLDFNNIGLSILEISHRSKDFVAVMENARSLVLELMNLDDNYTVLFLQGGASTQFLMTPFNFLKENGKAGYLDTGTWSNKAIKEAKMMGDIVVLGSSKEETYNHIPKGFEIPEGLDYVHYTSNNTIFGTQMNDFPAAKGALKICDMSSDIFSRQMDFAQFDMIYAGAQKNLGPAGATLVVVKKELLGKSDRQIPTMLDYNTHFKKDSMFNTPPVFSIYVSMLTLEWLKDNGGIEEMEKINNAKAALLYDEIDRNPLFEGHAKVEDRSKMNITFTLTDESKKEKFDQMWNEAGINGLNGHRSVGGYRASCYNALPLSSVQVLVDVMKQLEKEA
ncbi:MAG: 3-phosphoserine/phosphohydroxythreonine transaminase [Flavobacteriales bacterium]|jgi:phosphoserine aminotransferase|nr:3-phosphoserine/phosphohydroxythreonine transaminase [Flavobacteriales bacterium]